MEKIQWRAILRQFNYCCAYCGKQFVPNHRKHKLTKDHVQPLAKGGSDSKNNIVPACKRCNAKKGDKMPLEYFWERL